MKALILSLAFQIFAFYSMAQCPQSTVVITIVTDNYPQETSWTLSTADGMLIETESLNGEEPNATVTFEICVDADVCLEFVIEDSFNDGINFPGSFEVALDGAVVVSNAPFTSDYVARFNCASGTSCNSAEPITEGSYETIYDDHWYRFVPDSSGRFELTTCELTDCDTKIWVYDNCLGFDGIEDNTGTITYDDNFGGCGEQANLNPIFEKDKVYYIRIGDDTDTCGDSIAWSLNFVEFIVGCTDSTSCNYNPIAVIDDGSCIANGSPDCPEAPDLVIDEEKLRTSIFLDTIFNDDDCWIQEGCLQGYGRRDIIKFDTKISNIGELDYFIGLEDTDVNGQFTFDNCHNHWHYDGYAEYLLYDSTGQETQIGFKNGFCVIDLGCESGGSPKYDCTNMGITAGCYDEYWSGIDCQWVDITDVPEGDYTLVTRVNWDNAPDALGRVEKDSLNNWAQACIRIDRSMDSLSIEVYEECDSYRDCAGVLFGSSQIDCTGECGGLTLMGDVDQDFTQSLLDLELYMQGIITNDMDATACNDLTGDGLLDIYDISLLASCLNFGGTHFHPDNGPHDHCEFPRDVTADEELASLEIVDFDGNSYIDIAMKNPNSQVIGYQFSISGVNITHVESLMDTSEYAHSVVMDPVSNIIMSYSTNDQFIERNTELQDLVRVYFSMDLSPAIICIDNIEGIINEKLERVESEITGNCIVISSTTSLNSLAQLSVFPNPTTQYTTVQWDSDQKIFGWELTNIQGQRMMSEKGEQDGRIDLDLNQLTSGLYILKIRSEQGNNLIKIIKQS